MLASQDSVASLLFTHRHRRIDRLARSEPLFISVTCSSSVSGAMATLGLCRHILEVCAENKLIFKSRTTQTRPLLFLQFAGVSPLMHLTCAGKSEEELKAILAAAKEAGVCNILALTGDVPAAGDQPSLKAVDLVKLARAEHGTYFCIGVGAYPGGWVASGSPAPATVNLEAEVAALLTKQSAGAQFAVTQFLFDHTQHKALADAAKSAGVTIPIIPGILAVDRPRLVGRMAKQCGVQLSQAVQAEVDGAGPWEDDPDANATTSDPLAGALAQLAASLVAAGAPGVHLYTLNLEGPATTLVQTAPLQEALAARGGAAVLRRRLPWRAPVGASREGEAVRPIFWANRPNSYIQRTSSWQEFPQGRWSEVAETVPGPALTTEDAGSAAGADSGQWGSGSAAPGTPTSAGAGCSELGGWGPPADRRVMWGERLDSEAAVWNVFAGYMAGSVPRLPWCEAELHPETSHMTSRLVQVNQAGLLTINSQPAVAGEASDHPVHGWGGAGGLVYQKAYVEFFARPELVSAIMEVAARPAFAAVRYMAVDAKGNSYTNSTASSATAVTWGVFPGREVVQPTVVDPAAFQVWREEAFGLWRNVWASAYDEDSETHALLHDIASKYYLVNVVDNDFMGGDVWAFIHAVLVAAGGEGLQGVALTEEQATPAGTHGGSLMDTTPAPAASLAVSTSEGAAAVVAGALGFDSPSAAASLTTPRPAAVPIVPTQ